MVWEGGNQQGRAYGKAGNGNGNENGNGNGKWKWKMEMEMGNGKWEMKLLHSTIAGLGTDECERYVSPLTAGAFSHTSHNLTPFFALPADCALSQVDRNLADKTTSPSAESANVHFLISSFPHFLISHFLISRSCF